MKGFGKTTVNNQAIDNHLTGAWEVLSEAVQTVMRKHGHTNPYDKLKEITRGKAIGEEEIKAFTASVDIPEEDKIRLLALTPQKYIGIAAELVKHVK